MVQLRALLPGLGRAGGLAVRELKAPAKVLRDAHFGA